LRRGGSNKHGFEIDIAVDTAPQGLNEDMIRLISAKKDEPQFLLDFRRAAYCWWLQQKEPNELVQRYRGSVVPPTIASMQP